MTSVACQFETRTSSQRSEVICYEERPWLPARIREAWQRFVSGRELGPLRADLRDLIAERWRICQEAGLDPRLRSAPSAGISDEELERFLLNHELGRAGKAVLDDFGRVAEAGGQVIVLADAQGRIWHRVGNERLLKALATVNFQPGALWSERAVGPNGVGTPLAMGAASFVFGPEHFCESWQNLVCYGCPVRDPNSGNTIGVVDVTGASEQADRAGFDLAVSLAGFIERMLTAYGLGRRKALLEAYLNAQRKWPRDGVVLLDEGGRIVEANPRALDLLAGNFSLLLGQRLEVALPEAAPLLRRSLENGDWIETSVGRPREALRARCGPFVADGRVAGSFLILSRAEGTGAGTRAASRASDGAHRAEGSALYTLGDALGSAPAFLEALRSAQIAARSDKNVLLTGETGAGKELFAQAIHCASNRCAGPFVAVNCAALPRELIESELFGYAPGAFTGASRQGARGKFELARGGTIFLDEIGAMAPELQAKLLRVLESKAFSRLGDHAVIDADSRVIAASNQDLKALAAEKLFRLDLFYRLNVLPIRIPALRERREDILPLAQVLIARECQAADRSGITFSPEVADCLRRYEWPGNVRELKNLCERWAEALQADVVHLSDLPEELRCYPPIATDQPPQGCSLEQAEVELIRDTLRQTRNVSEAARRLGISRTTIYKKLKPVGAVCPQPARVLSKV